MLRLAFSKLVSGQVTARTTAIRSTVRLMSSHGVQETDAEFDARYEAFFNRPDIDGWEIRKAMGDLAGMDLVPEPTIVAAGLTFSLFYKRSQVEFRALI